MKNRAIAWSQLSAVAAAGPPAPGHGAAPRPPGPGGGGGLAVPPPGWGGGGGLGAAGVPPLPPRPAGLGAAGDPPLGPKDGPGAGGGLSAVGALPGGRPCRAHRQPAVRLPAGSPRPSHRRRPAAGGVDGRRRAARLCPGLRGLSPGGGGGVRGDPPLWHLPAGLVPHLALDPGRSWPRCRQGPCPPRGPWRSGGMPSSSWGMCGRRPGARMGCSAGWPCCLPCWRGRCSWFWVSWAAPWRSRSDRPFLQMVSGLGFEGAFQRLEELVSALWVLGDVALLGLLLLCLGRLLAWLLDLPGGEGEVLAAYRGGVSPGAARRAGGPSPGRGLGALWEPGGGGPPGADPAGNGGRKKVGKKRKKGLTFLDGRGILSKLSQDRGEKAGRKEEKTS